MRPKSLRGSAGLAQSLWSGAIILTLTSVYLLGSFGLLVIFASLDILRIKKLGRH
jgi:hypothetical protein